MQLTFSSGNTYDVKPRPFNLKTIEVSRHVIEKLAAVSDNEMLKFLTQNPELLKEVQDAGENAIVGVMLKHNPEVAKSMLGSAAVGKGVERHIAMIDCFYVGVDTKLWDEADKAEFITAEYRETLDLEEVAEFVGLFRKKLQL